MTNHFWRAINAVFDVIFMLGAVLAIPLAGLLLYWMATITYILVLGLL